MNYMLRIFFFLIGIECQGTASQLIPGVTGPRQGLLDQEALMAELLEILGGSPQLNVNFL